MSNSDSPTRSGLDLDGQLTALAALSDPLRRRLYRYVCDQPAATNRDQVAAALGIPRHIAKFHLDRLAQDGLFDIEYRRPDGRTGPGAGRPTKLYRQGTEQISVNVPPRHYDLAARLLAQGITRAQTQSLPIAQALTDEATRAGQTLGGKIDATDSPMTAICSTLNTYGYQARHRPSTPDSDTEHHIDLFNCPFDTIAADFPDLICGINHSYLAGLVSAVQPEPNEPIRADLTPASGRCCVTISQKGGCSPQCARTP